MKKNKLFEKNKFQSNLSAQSVIENVMNGDSEAQALEKSNLDESDDKTEITYSDQKEEHSMKTEKVEPTEKSPLVLSSSSTVEKEHSTKNHHNFDAVATKSEYQNFHHIIVKFTNITQSASAFVILNADKYPAVWSEGPNNKLFKGLSIASHQQKNLMVSSFSINGSELYIQALDDIIDLYIDLFVETNNSILSGIVNLPPGASVTIESSFDSTSLIDMGSFSISLEPK